VELKIVRKLRSVKLQRFMWKQKRLVMQDFGLADALVFAIVRAKGVGEGQGILILRLLRRVYCCEGC
jgi:hypothetical protein